MNYQYIDLQSLEEDTLGSVEIQKEIMVMFLKLIEEYDDVLNSELPNKNWDALYGATHRIKPNIRMFGITKLEPVILELEEKLRKEENLEGIDELFQTVQVGFQNVKNEIELELKAMDNG